MDSTRIRGSRNDRVIEMEKGILEDCMGTTFVVQFLEQETYLFWNRKVRSSKTYSTI